MAMITSFLMTLLLQLWLLNTFLASAMFFDDSNTEYYDTVTLRDVTPTSSRSRRSADDMPDHLHFDFKAGSHEVSLRLRRSEHIHMAKLPVFTVGDNQRLIKVDLPDKTDTAVYRDIYHGAAIIAKRQHGVGKEFHLVGTLHVGKEMLTIAPRTASHDVRSEAMQHVLRVVQNDATYGHDYVEPEDVGPSSLNPRRRQKRQLKPVSSDVKQRRNEQKTGRFNIKINIVCDFACFQKFFERHGRNEKRALEEARMYFSYLAQSLDVRLRTISTLKPGLLLTVTPVSIVSATTPKGASFSEQNRVNGTARGINGNKLLPAFRAWAAKAKLPKAATALLQTGYNMMTTGLPAKSGQLGIGYRGGACGSSGVVVVEEKFHGITGMIAAHELGHNLNSMHDGSYAKSDTTCSKDGLRYVMSTYIGVPHGSSKPWFYSPCSAESIVQFVTVRRPTCFADDYEQLVPDDAGQVYDADNQCSTTFGKGSYFCRGRQKLTVGFNGMCTKMYCSTTPAEDNTCTAIIPLEYTSCGDRKWCVRGQCVNDARAPAKVQDTCAQGDDPTYSCNVASCRTALGRNVYCCQSCLQPLAPPSVSSERQTSSVFNRHRQIPPAPRLTQPPGPTRFTQPPVTNRITPSTGTNAAHARPPTPPRLPTTSRQTQSPTTQRRQQTTTRQRPATPEITTTPSPPETAPTTQRVPLVCRYNKRLCYICFRAKNRYYFCRQ